MQNTEMINEEQKRLAKDHANEMNPQGLKPRSYDASGTAEAVPFPSLQRAHDDARSMRRGGADFLHETVTRIEVACTTCTSGSAT